jgi:molecular chaperone GrpE
MDDEPPAEPTVAPAEPAAPPAPGPAPPPEDWESRFKYLLADFENFRRRSEREKESARQHARGGLLRELLPILEAFRAAREAVGRLPASDPVRNGFELLDREWAKLLKHEGVEPVATVGEPFRSDEEEAVGEMSPRSGVADGTVGEIVQQGYRFFGGLLRPAKVIVARALPAAAPSGAAAEPPEPEGAP